MSQTLLEKNYQYYLQTDISSYIGEWLVICDGKIVAHNRDVKMAVREAQKKFPDKKLMIARAPDKETMIF